MKFVIFPGVFFAFAISVNAQSEYVKNIEKWCVDHEAELKSENGKVILDFNRAENPPCAFTSFAVCSLPPPQNRLEVEIKAGEKRCDH